MIGSAAGVISGGKGVSISGRSFSNVDVNAGTVANIRDRVIMQASGNASSTIGQATGNIALAGVTSGSGNGGNIAVAGQADAKGGASNVALGGLAGASGKNNNLATTDAVDASASAGNVNTSNTAGASGRGNHAATTGPSNGSGSGNSIGISGSANASGQGGNVVGVGAVDANGNAGNVSTSNAAIAASGSANHAATTGPANGSGSGDSIGKSGSANASANAGNVSTSNAASGNGSGSGNHFAVSGRENASANGGHFATAGAAGASGNGNSAELGAQAGGSGLLNGFAAAGKTSASGTANPLDTRGSGVSNSTRDGASGLTAGSQVQNAAPLSGAVVKVTPNGLSTVNPDASGSYLFETRPQFANRGQWTSSDYLLKALEIDPAATQKRLGDGFYEQRLVRDQLIELTGRAPAGGESDDTRYKNLLNSGINFAQQYQLRPGVALSAEQISHLTSDIVWMETQTVSLPDGRVEQVLVPKVYLANAGGVAVQPGGALVTGDGVKIDVSDSIVNSGGVIDGGNGRSVLIAGQDIVNQGGVVKSGSLELRAGGDVRNESLTVRQDYAITTGGTSVVGSYTSLSNQAAMIAKDGLSVVAGRDIVDAGGIIAGAGIGLQAGRDISFNAVQTGSTYSAQGPGYTERDSAVVNRFGQLAGSGDLAMIAGRDLALQGTQVTVGGSAALAAGGNISIAAVVDELNVNQESSRGKNYDKKIEENQTVIGASVAAGKPRRDISIYFLRLIFHIMPAIPAIVPMIGPLYEK